MHSHKYFTATVKGGTFLTNPVGVPCKYSRMFDGSLFTLMSTESFFPMHQLKETLKNSVMALLGAGEVSSSVLEARTEDVRQFILDELGEAAEKNHPHIIRRVRYAKDIQGLWYTRGYVMAVLAAMHGETIALEKIARISGKFKGLLPRGMSSRPSPLSS